MNPWIGTPTTNVAVNVYALKAYEEVKNNKLFCIALHSRYAQEYVQ